MLAFSIKNSNGKIKRNIIVFSVSVFLFFIGFCMTIANDNTYNSENNSSLSPSQEDTTQNVSDNTNTSNDTSTQKSSNLENEKQAMNDIYLASKQQINGHGDTATDPIKLKKGFAIFEFTHNGDSNFMVDMSGSGNQGLVNEIGNYKGKVITNIPSDGDYYLNIKADGDWNAIITQGPNPDTIQNAPTTLNGHGDDVVFFNITSGSHKLTLRHSGDSNFIVDSLENGKGIVNEIGSYSGSTREDFSDGLNGFSIKADGDWSIVIE